MTMPILNINNTYDESGSGLDLLIDSESLRESNRRQSHPNNLFSRRESNAMATNYSTEDTAMYSNGNYQPRFSGSSNKPFNYYNSYLDPMIMNQPGINENIIQSFYTKISNNFNVTTANQLPLNMIKTTVVSPDCSNSSINNYNSNSNTTNNTCSFYNKRCSEPTIYPCYRINTPEVKFNVSITHPKTNFGGRSNSFIEPKNFNVYNTLPNTHNTSINQERSFTPFSELTDSELLNNAANMAKHQKGCRFLQDKIDDNSPFANAFITPSFLESVPTLAKDTFGNYFIQKLISYLTPENLSLFLDRIDEEFENIAINCYGTRSIQKLIECISSNKNSLEKFNRMFLRTLMTIIKDSNGNHIVQRYFNLIKYPDNIEAFDVIMYNLIEIATDKNGCCVIQKCIDYVSNEMKVTKFLMNLGSDYNEDNR